MRPEQQRPGEAGSRAGQAESTPGQPDEPALQAEKERLRRELDGRRRRLSPEERGRLSARVQGHLLSTPEYQEAGTILFYWAVRGEAETQAAIAAALSAGKRVALPRVVNWQRGAPGGLVPVYGAGGRGLALHQYRGPEDLVSGPFGLQEPDPEAPPLLVGELDLVVVPGVAFDRRGGRIGHGGGYYDRFLPHVPARVPQLGYAFSFQVVERLPRGPYDQPVNGLVTEAGVLRFRRQMK